MTTTDWKRPLPPDDLATGRSAGIDEESAQGIDEGADGRVTAARRGAPSHRGAAGWRGNLSASRIALVLVVLLSAGLVGLHIHAYRQLSPYDEPQHIDYTYRLLQGNVPASGDHWLPATVAAVACRTIDYPLDVYPPCGGPATPDVLPSGGLTTAFGHTPAYYLLPAAAVWVSTHLLPVHVDDISVMRATGALWLALAIALLWLLCRELGVAWQVRAALSLGLVASPVVLLTQSTVNNDTTALAAGAAVTLATLWWDARGVRLWVPAGTAVLALLFKVTSLSVLILACVYVLVRCWQRSELPGRLRWKALDRRSLAFVGVLAGATVVVSGGWTVISSMRATLDPKLIGQNVLVTVSHFDPSWLPTSLLALVSPVQPQFMQSVMQGAVGVTAASLVNVGLLVLPVVGAVRSEPGSRVRGLAIATGVALLSFGPLLTLINYFTMSQHITIPARYGLALVPALAAIGGTGVRSRAGGWALLALSVAVFGAVAAHLLAR